ncbi:MAG: DUF4386 domain-containing protein [Actinomycetota bacterium]|nr:DUF4386 domain-containing protein [Actinomycetota bacterium]
MTSKFMRSEQTEKGLRQPFRWERLALASGILFAAVQIATVAFNVVFFLTTHPPMDASPQETARGFAQQETMVEIGIYLYVLQVPFWLLFLGGLSGVLRRVEGGSGALSVSVLGAGVAMVVIASMGALISALTPIIGQLGGDAATVKAIDGMTPLALALSAFPRAVLLGGTSVILLESRLAPRWIGWAGLALGLISLLSTGTLVAPALFPFLAIGTVLFVVWVLTLSVALLRSTRTESLVAPGAEPTT